MYKLKEPRCFQVWTYTVSHRTLIIRSEQQYPDVDYATKYSDNRTIDLEFSGVVSMDISNQFTLISISIEVPSSLNQVNGDYKVFRLNCKDRVIRITAQGCIIGTSSWINKNRVSHPYENYDDRELL